MSKCENRKTTEQINETKSCFLKNVNKIDKLLGRLIKIKREQTQITHIRNETRVITTDPAATTRIIKGYHQQLYVHKFANSEETDQFLKNDKSTKLNQDETDNLIGFKAIKEVEFVIKNLKNKSPGPGSFTGEF